jgi:hypothetical protein
MLAPSRGFWLAFVGHAYGQFTLTWPATAPTVPTQPTEMLIQVRCGRHLKAAGRMIFLAGLQYFDKELGQCHWNQE